jgi:hypothetical protein
VTAAVLTEQQIATATLLPSQLLTMTAVVSPLCDSSLSSPDHCRLWHSSASAAFFCLPFVPHTHLAKFSSIFCGSVNHVRVEFYVQL